LSRQKAVVLDAPAAQHLVVSARCEDGGAAVFVVATATAGVRLRAYRTIYGRRAAEVRLGAAGAERLGGAGGDGGGPLAAGLRPPKGRVWARTPRTARARWKRSCGGRSWS